MERPDIGRRPEAISAARLLGSTPDILEARRIAERFCAEGWRTWIEEKGTGSVRLFQVWGRREGDAVRE